MALRKTKTLKTVIFNKEHIGKHEGNKDSLKHVLIFTVFTQAHVEHIYSLRDLIPFVQFKKHEKHPWRSVNFSKVTRLKLVTLLKLKLLHRFF